MNRNNTLDYAHQAPAPAAPSPGFLTDLVGHIKTSVIATIVLGIIVSGAYPLIVWGIAQVVFNHQANGSLIGKDGQSVSKDADAVGSSLIGQGFSAAQYFHPRPSAAGNGYDATASGGSNLGPTSAKLLLGTTKKDDKGNDVVDFDGIRDRIVHYCDENGIAYESSVPLAQFKDKDGNLDDMKLIKSFNDDKSPLVFMPKIEIPADAVTASGSGLDPHISVANANLQAQRVADARHVPVDKVKGLIKQFTEGPNLGILGDAGVNVLRLNLALDKDSPAPTTQPSP